jgi:hypothetical protein
MTVNLINEQDQSLVQLFAGDFDVAVKPVTIVAGSGVLTKGTVLGKVKLGAATKAAKTGGNTGNGTLTLDVTTPILANAKVGVYQLRIVRAAVAAVAAVGQTSNAVPAQAAIANLIDPKGNVLGSFDVPTTPGITISNQVKFALVDGSSPFILGDGFDITIAAGSLKYKPYNDANVDGSDKANCILAQDVDATNEAPCSAFIAGWFNSAALTGLDAAAQDDFEYSPILIGSVI